MRTAVFGGSFNPVHNGHIGLARELTKKASLDRVIVMPTYISPFKKNDGGFVADGRDRLEMCRLAFEGMSFVTVSDYELAKGGISYSVDTVEYLHAIYPDDELFFIMGSDMLLSFDKWRSYERILSLCTVIAASRINENEDYPALAETAEKLSRKGSVRVEKISAFEVSSSLIREKINKNQDISCYVPKNVVKYISDAGLYV